MEIAITRIRISEALCEHHHCSELSQGAKQLRFGRFSNEMLRFQSHSKRSLERSPLQMEGAGSRQVYTSCRIQCLSVSLCSRYPIGFYIYSGVVYNTLEPLFSLPR